MDPAILNFLHEIRSWKPKTKIMLLKTYYGAPKNQNYAPENLNYAPKNQNYASKKQDYALRKIFSVIELPNCQLSTRMRDCNSTTLPVNHELRVNVILSEFW